MSVGGCRGGRANPLEQDQQDHYDHVLDHDDQDCHLFDHDDHGQY